MDLLRYSKVGLGEVEVELEVAEKGEAEEAVDVGLGGEIHNESGDGLAVLTEDGEVGQGGEGDGL